MRSMRGFIFKNEKMHEAGRIVFLPRLIKFGAGLIGADMGTNSAIARLTLSVPDGLTRYCAMVWMGISASLKKKI